MPKNINIEFWESWESHFHTMEGSYKMTIEKLGEDFGFISPVFQVNCDFCSNYFEVETEYFSKVISEMRDVGWKYFKDENNEWTHKCLDCQEEG